VTDAYRYEVKAFIKRKGRLASSNTLAYAGVTSQFSGTLSVEEPGTNEAVIYAHDPSIGNTGLDKVTYIDSK
jgi:hypothetical protein